jgi:hypothetical protein
MIGLVGRVGRLAHHALNDSRHHRGERAPVIEPFVAVLIA